MKRAEHIPPQRIHIPAGMDIRELAQSLRRDDWISLLIDHMRDAVWLMDLTLNFVFISPSATKSTGYTLDELLALTPERLLTPESLAIYRASIVPVFAAEACARNEGEISANCELEVLCKDGSPILCDITLALLRDASGVAIGILGMGRDITARAEAERQLSQSQQDYRQLVENINDAIFFLDLNGCITYISPTIQQVVGYTSEECIGLSFQCFIHPDDLTMVQEIYASRLDGQRHQVEFRIIDKNQVTHYVRSSSRPIEKDGRIIGISGALYDITQWKLAEMALHRSEERYRNIIESIDDGYYETDLAGKITFFNDKIPDIYGYPPDEILYRNFRVFTDEESAQTVYTTCHEMFLGKRSSTILDWEITRKDGRKVTIENSISLLRDQDGRPIGFHGIVRDITQSRQALRELHKLSRALEQSPVSVVITDARGAIEYINPKFTTLTGYTFEEVRGQNPRILKSGETNVEEYRRLWEAITQGREWRGEFHNRRKDGTLFWERASISPLFDDSGAITHFLAVKEDITAHKQMEEAQRQIEARYRMLADNIQDVVWVVRDQRFSYVSPSVKDQWGYEPRELLGRHLGDVISSHSYQTIKEQLGEISDSVGPGDFILPFEIEIVRKNGEFLWTEVKISRIDIPGESAPAILGVSRDISLRKVVEDALNSNLNLMQVLTDSIPHPIFHTDLGGRIVGCNKAFETIVGIDKGDMLSRPLNDVVPEDSPLKSIATGLSDQSDCARLEVPAVPYADGSLHDIVFSSTSFTNAMGEPVGLVGVIFDITDQKRHALELQAALDESRKTQQEIAALLETAHAVLESRSFEQAIDHIYHACKSLSKAACGYVTIRQNGQMRHEIVLGDTDFGPDPVWVGEGLSADAVRALIDERGKAVFFNTPSGDSDGIPDGHIPKNILYAPIVVEGRPQGRIVLVNKPGGFTEEDLHLTRALCEFAAIALLNSRTLQALETSEKRFRSVAQTANDAIITFDAEGRVIFWNIMAERMFGYGEAEMLGKDFSIVLSSRNKSANSQVLRRMIQTISQQAGKNMTSIGRTAEMQGLRRDGREFPFEISISVWETDNRRYFTAIIRDITERKRMEDSLHRETDELKKARADLEQAYTELKQTQAQILQREKMASIGQLAAGVAHEINNPMGFISSNLRTLEKYTKRLADFIAMQTDYIKASGDPSALEESRSSLKIDYIVQDIRDLIHESLEGAERVKRIVQDLKSFSRVDQAEFKHADINECLESTINIVWNELKYKATVNRDYGNLPMTKCFPQQLNQVFMNLLVNAAQAIEKQGEITVKTWREDTCLFASISDTGCGIEPEKLNRIFEPFYTTKPVGTGTGLGLSITYDIIKKHGGEIYVQSEVGKGTTFTVRIPIVEDK